MKTLWSKGKSLDQKILDFTVGNDREIDSNFIKQDIIGSIGHVFTLLRSGVLTEKEHKTLCKELVSLYRINEKRSLKIGIDDEDVHSMLEKILTNNLGEVGKKVHTARSRNDQIATDISLWIRDETLKIHKELHSLSNSFLEISRKNKETLMLGMTHLQPAMPNSVGAWLLSYSSLFLEDLKQVERAYDAALNCPLGSAAGYGVPSDVVDLDRKYTASILGFYKSFEPVTVVQNGRGKIESTFLFAACQILSTASRLARDIVLYMNPQFGFISLPEQFTTGSSIMPQKKNPDVAELIRSSVHVVQSCLNEVMSISSSVSSGYHRDFQRLKYPLIRGISLTKQVVDILNYIVPQFIFHEEKMKDSCSEDIYATKRALELVKSGMTFRDAYRKVAEEVNSGELPKISGEKYPDISKSLIAIENEILLRKDWYKVRARHERLVFHELVKDFV